MAGKKYYIDNKRFEKIIPLYLQTPAEYEDELMGLYDLLITNIIESFNDKLKGNRMVITR